MVLTRSSLPITIRRSKNSIPLCLFASRQEAPAPSLQRVCIVEKNVPVHRSGSLCLRLKKLLLQPNSPCRFDMGQLWTRISLQDLACLLEYDPSLRGGEPSAPQPFARTAGAHGNARWRERAADETDISGQHHLLNRDVDFGTSATTGFDFRVEISNRSIERNELRIIKLRNLDIETAMDGNHEIKEVH